MSKRGRRPVSPGRPQTRGAIERSQSFLIVGVCVVVAVAIIVAAAWQPVSAKIRLSVYRDQSLQDVGASASGAGCQSPITMATTGSIAEGIEGDGTFVTAPPAYGPYSAASSTSTTTSTSSTTSGPVTGATFYDTTDRPPLTDLVGDEYAGYTILWYDSSVGGSQLAQIQAIVKKFDNSADDREDLVAAPWTDADKASVSKPVADFPAGTHIAFTHWSAGGVGASSSGKQQGVFQYCSKVSGSALKTFMEDYPYIDSPSPGTLPTQQATS